MLTTTTINILKEAYSRRRVHASLRPSRISLIIIACGIVDDEHSLWLSKSSERYSHEIMLTKWHVHRPVCRSGTHLPVRIANVCSHHSNISLIEIPTFWNREQLIKQIPVARYLCGVRFHFDEKKVLMENEVQSLNITSHVLMTTVAFVPI